ncbi:MAG: hypothetical protein JXB45_07440 [Candidatus Krumholzibacteriota bacterium]|nr:hypothetical protein [Candidatus Krumholzibacteriota bacterium]
MPATKAADNIEKIKLGARHLGLDIVSTARLGGDHRKEFHPSIREISASLEYAVVIGIRLSQPVLLTVETAPTWTYYYHYRNVNFALDQAALRISGFVQKMGFRALPLPASQILDWDRLRGHLSHREMGEAAGIGWRGRNNLLVTEEFGSQVRYTTILTDLPLPGREDPPEPWGCGDCRRCLSVCPVSAIHEDPADFELDKCAAQLRRFAKSEKLNTLICGLCLRVCGGKDPGEKLKG